MKKKKPAVPWKHISEILEWLNVPNKPCLKVQSDAADSLRYALECSQFKPLGLCCNIWINVDVFDRAMRLGYKLDLITGRYQKL